jgi:hypothetical protein
MEYSKMGSSLILPDFVLPSRVNQCWQYSGIDSIEHCFDKNHFRQYPHSITYNYNSRGFRDQEWPDSIAELKNSIWCVGDSFTVGLGSPLEHTWPWILQQATQRRIINVSMDGASNMWIARHVNLIKKQIDPKNIIVMWSYVSRREHENQNLTSEQRRIQSDKTDNLEDLFNFKSCQAMIQPGNAIQLAIPGYRPYLVNYRLTWRNIRGVDWPANVPLTPSELLALPKFVQTELKDHFNIWTDLQQSLEQQLLLSNLEKYLVRVNKLDLARDGHHFDIITSQWVVDQIIQRLN